MEAGYKYQNQVAKVTQIQIDVLGSTSIHSLVDSVQATPS